MKAIHVLLLVFFSTICYSQTQSLAFVNSGAMSRNMSCGIGEIFIVPAREAEKPKIFQNNLVNKNILSNGLTVYPNPTSGIVYINTNLGIKTLSVYSSEGKLIKDIDISKDKKIDLTYLQSGVYVFIPSEPNLKPIKIIKR